MVVRHNGQVIPTSGGNRHLFDAELVLSEKHLEAHRAPAKALGTDLVTDRQVYLCVF